MSLPPPNPTPVRSGKGIPGWTWPIIIGAPLVLIGAVFLISQITPEKPMEAWRPTMGVPHVQPGEQLSMGSDGAFVYRNKQTGVERTVRNEPLPIAEPAWLHVPVEAKRLTALGRRGGGRRQALFSYNIDGDLGHVFAAFERPLRKEGLSVKVDSRWQVMQLIGADAQREVLVHGERNGTRQAMTLPPPLPATRARAVPGWVWMAVLLGALAMSSAAAVFSGLFWFGRQVHLAEELPVKGVDVSVSADEERSVGPNGEVRIRHRVTGRLRAVRVEGEQTPLPDWLTLPPHSVRVAAWSRWGDGRREAMFRYMVPLSAVDFHDRYERVMEWERWEARTSRMTTLAVVNGVHKRLDRELLMSARPMTDDSVEVTIRLTEPATGDN